MKPICSFTRRADATALAIFIACMLSGCDKVTMPTSDSTPPTVSWSVQKNGGSSQNLPAISTINAAKGDKFSVTLMLKDSEGMKNITLGSSGSYACSSGNFSENKSFSGATDAQNLGPDSNGKVLTKIILTHDFDTASLSCDSGSSFTGGSYVFNGSGENYFRGTATGKLTISIAP